MTSKQYMTGGTEFRLVASLTLVVIVALLFGCAKKQDAAHHIALGDWTTESNCFGAFLAADSAPMADSEPVLQAQPTYRADTVYHGIIQSYVGDPHGGRHLVRDRDSLGNDIFYFDANNNEDLTDDGPPMHWTVDSVDTMQWLDLNVTLPDGTLWSTQFIAGGFADQQMSETIGRPVLIYAVFTHTARHGWWMPRHDSLPVEFYTFQPPNPEDNRLANWFVLIDVNQDGIFDPQPPDLLISSAEPSFEFDSLLWRVSIDKAAEGITLTSEPIEEAPSVEGFAESGSADADADSTAYRDYMLPMGIKLRAPSFAGYDSEGNYVSLDSLRGRVVVLNFWTGSCVPCRVEIPMLNRVADKFGDQVEFIALLPEGKEMADRLLSALDFHYRIVPEASRAVRDYGVSGYPVHVLIDQNGYVRFSQMGAAADMDVRIEGWIRAMIDRQG